MSNLETLKGQFLVSHSLSDAKMMQLLEVAIHHCVVDGKGHVEIKNPSLTTKDKLMLIMSARFIAHHLEEGISSDVTSDELSKNAHVAAEQVRARCSELVKDRQIEVVNRGVYRAMLHRIEPFLVSLKR